MNWGDWVLDPDQNVRQVRGTDGYLVGRVALHDHNGRFCGYESRRNLVQLELNHFTTEEEKRLAAEILQEARELFGGEK